MLVLFLLWHASFHVNCGVRGKNFIIVEIATQHRMLEGNFKLHYIKGYGNSQIAYIDEGAGEQTLLLIHGLATSSLSWTKNIAELSRHFRVIAIDLPGNGHSQHGNFNYNIGFYANSIIDLIGRLGLKQVCIIGHSMGAQVALYAVSEADCADKLILCAPAGFETFSAMERQLYLQTIAAFDFFSTDENSLRKTIQSSFYKNNQQADELIDELVRIMHQHSKSEYRKVMNDSVLGMLEQPVFDRLSTIKQPALVLFGERDALIPNRMLHPTSTRQVAEKGCRQMPDATLMMIPECGHFLQWERAAFVNEQIIGWLKH